MNKYENMNCVAFPVVYGNNLQRGLTKFEHAQLEILCALITTGKYSIDCDLSREGAVVIARKTALELFSYMGEQQ